jgi:hypothetical protein
LPARDRNAATRAEYRCGSRSRCLLLVVWQAKHLFVGRTRAHKMTPAMLCETQADLSMWEEVYEGPAYYCPAATMVLSDPSLIPEAAISLACAHFVGYVPVADVLADMGTAGKLRQRVLPDVSFPNAKVDSTSHARHGMADLDPEQM